MNLSKIKYYTCTMNGVQCAVCVKRVKYAKQETNVESADNPDQPSQYLGYVIQFINPVWLYLQGNTRCYLLNNQHSFKWLRNVDKRNTRDFNLLE